MDPQQRLLLEVALGGARGRRRSRPTRSAGARTGVFVGICDRRLRAARMHAGRPASLDAYAGTGNAHSVAANRLSYVLGLRGPSVAVDTACSSSLVAVHLACQSLRAGECDAGAGRRREPDAARPRRPIGFSQAAACCRPTAAARPSTRAPTATSAARAAAWSCSSGCPTRCGDGDRVLAVIRGTAVNQDGRSNGLTAPNGPAQEAVIRRALEPRGRRRRARSATSRPTARHAARRPDRGRRARRGARRGPPGGRAAGRLGEDQHRPPRGGRRHRRPDQGRAGARSTARSRRTCTSRAEPAHRRGTRCRSRSPTAADAWPRSRRRALAGRQLVRLRRHQRPRRARGGAAGAGARRRARPAERPCSSRCRRAATRGAARARRRGWPSTSPARPRRAAGRRRASPPAPAAPHLPDRGGRGRARRARSCARRRWPSSRRRALRPVARRAAAGGAPEGRVPVHRPGRAVRGMGRELYEHEPRCSAHALDRAGERARARSLDRPLLDAALAGRRRRRPLARDGLHAARAVRAGVRARRAVARRGASSPTSCSGHSVGEYVGRVRRRRAHARGRRSRSSPRAAG